MAHATQKECAARMRGAPGPQALSCAASIASGAQFTLAPASAGAGMGPAISRAILRITSGMRTSIFWMILAMSTTDSSR